MLSENSPQLKLAASVALGVGGALYVGYRLGYKKAVDVLFDSSLFAGKSYQAKDGEVKSVLQLGGVVLLKQFIPFALRAIIFVFLSF